MDKSKLIFFNRANINVLKTILQNALKEQERDILDLQQEQMYAGITDTGLPIQPDYAPYTIEQKKDKGQPYDRVTLKDTGEFYREQYVKFTKERTEITTRSRKRLKLQRKYEDGGGDLFGLIPQNVDRLGAIVLPLVQEGVKEYILDKLVKKI